MSAFKSTRYCTIVFEFFTRIAATSVPNQTLAQSTHPAIEGEPTMTSSSEIVDVGHVGGVEEVTSDWKGIWSVFHNFALLPSECGKFVSSPLLECHGLQWRVDLYPGGVLNASTGRDVKVSILLHCASCDSSGQIVKARHRTKIPSANRVRADTKVRFFGPERGCAEEIGLIRSTWGAYNIARREEVIKPHQPFLTDGNLVVEVDIQVLMDKIPDRRILFSGT